MREQRRGESAARARTRPQFSRAVAASRAAIPLLTWHSRSPLRRVRGNSQAARLPWLPGGPAPFAAPGSTRATTALQDFSSLGEGSQLPKLINGLSADDERCTNQRLMTSPWPVGAWMTGSGRSRMYSSTAREAPGQLLKP